MEAEHHAEVVGDDDVIELRAELDPPIGRPTPALVELPIRGIDEQRIVRGVELDVGGAETDELGDLLAKDLRDVAEERLQRVVRVRGAGPGPRSSRTGSGSGG